MHPTGVVANVSVADLAEARDFYVDFSVSALKDSTWAGSSTSNLQTAARSSKLVTGDATAPVDSVISVHVGDQVETAYEAARRRGFEIVHPLTTEPWGVRRFFVRAPDGNVVNIVDHKDEDA